MSKVVLMMSFLALNILLVFGLFSPNSTIMWLASTSINFAILRMTLMIVLVALLVTKPPRNVLLRVFIGFLSVGLASWSLASTYNNQMKFMDTLVILQTCISAGLIILERDYKGIQEHFNLPALPKPNFAKQN